MTAFSKRDPLKIGIGGLLVLVLMFLLAMNFERLPLVGGTTYTAQFTEAAGLRADSEVRIAGVKVGTVSDVELEGDHVLVSFRVNDAWLGDHTTAAIKIKTLLGQKYLALDPQGGQELDPSEPIPLQRTMSPYDVIDAFSDLSTTVDKVDTRQLADSFRAMADTFADTPDEIGGALDGLSQLSQTISSRDEQLEQLLNNTAQVSRTIADRNEDFDRLLADGNLLLEEIRARRDSISALLDGTRQLSQQLSGLVDDNAAQIGPALQQLDRVTKMLQRNQDNLNRSLEMFAPFTRLFSNVVGNGRWFDSYVCGLLPPAIGPINQKGCQP
ncbi:phospholipid/cholesterol/gamma-HCH transport system substrate-binding protein [Saccharopolyspora kobensis]|uniref:Phospholipid/cholesterol/gamma-HCH transport system substrate-binding protein n=1 Tax=Saccharopolyspora kobensis TaxID=146035 RepID=A0A1H6DWQ1_9PSEU|nr:MCE family protein [Saccharopolyspora kobensis]SEG89688.1 phospholipid/cholesterol/gamma-HCH transport system substrate-binding protein [Saccharopolyspora kobensis]SFD86436.1 phospholipid/cholesterol/gamma-HCH transport system substrate-binding protein [Saccharopolyspora kobensis]